MNNLTTLVREYRTNRSKEAREEIIYKMQSVVKVLVMSFHEYGDHKNDMIHEGLIAVMASIESYDLTSAESFEDYARNAARVAIILYLIDNGLGESL